MGTISSKNTRRISIDNTFAVNCGVNIEPPSEDDAIDAIINVDDLQIDHNNNENIFKDSNRFIDNNDDNREYWVQRINYLKREHQLINKIIETEFEKTIHDNNLLQPSDVVQDKIQKIKPCFDLRSKILQCYEANPHQPLVCSAIVQAFNNYVTSYRIGE